MDVTTDILVHALAKLTGVSYEEALDAAVLYGIAYINQKNNLEMMEWTDSIKLPSIKDLEDLSE